MRTLRSGTAAALLGGLLLTGCADDGTEGDAASPTPTVTATETETATTTATATATQTDTETETATDTATDTATGAAGATETATQTPEPVAYPDTTEAYAEELVAAWVDGDAERVTQLAGPRVAGLMPLWTPTEVPPADDNPGGQAERDPALILMPDVQMLIDRSAVGGPEAVVGLAVLTDPVDGPAIIDPQAPAFVHAQRFQDAAREGDEAALEQLATPEALAGMEGDYVEGITEDSVVTGFLFEQDEPLAVYWSTPDDPQDYLARTVVLDVDAPTPDDAQPVIETGFVTIFGWGS